MKLALIQHDICWEDAPATRERITPLLAQAADTGARLLVLPELFATGFSMDARIAEPVDGPTTGFLIDNAAKLDAWVCGSVPERGDGADRPRNVFVLAGPAGELYRYAKRYPFTYAGEHEAYERGREPLTVNVEDLRITPAICYDLRFADHFWDRAASTDCYIVVANWPAVRRQHWRILLAARAIENQAYVAAVNRVGEGGGIAYVGDSCLITPSGEVLLSAGNTETVLAADIDPGAVARYRHDFPVLPDRRALPDGR